MIITNIIPQVYFDFVRLGTGAFCWLDQGSHDMTFFFSNPPQVREGHELAVIRGKGAGAANAGEDAAGRKGRKMIMEERLRYAQVVDLGLNDLLIGSAAI